MNWKYKAVMFLTLLILCVGSVCATEPNNTTSDNVTDSVNDYNTIRACINRLEANDIKQTKMINELNTTINNLKIDNKALNDKIDNQSVIINEVKEFNIINACEINNAVDFEVPFNFKEDYKHKDGSFIRYKNGCDHLINIQKIESEEDYYFYFVDGDDMKIFKTDTPNIYKRCETDGVFCEIDFIEMVKVNNKTYAVFILDTAQIDVWYDPTSLQDELNEFNKLNGIKPLKFL